MKKFEIKTQEDKIINDAIQRMLKAGRDDPTLLRSKEPEREQAQDRFVYKGFFIEVYRIQDNAYKAFAATLMADGEVKEFASKVFDTDTGAGKAVIMMIDFFRRTRPNIGVAYNGLQHRL